MLVGAGHVQPRDFWRLAPFEIWWIIDAHKPNDKAANLSQEEINELSELLDRGEF